MNILLAEDDAKLGKLIKYKLEKENFRVDWVQSGNDAFDYAKRFSYDILVLDWLMPGDTGINVCENLRRAGYQASILILTAKATVDDRVLGLEMGADDYLVKPFEFKELLARIRALARRKVFRYEDFTKVGDIVLSYATRTVTRKGQEIQLTRREFQLLDLFAQNYGNVLTREVIIDHIWELESEVTSNNLDSFIRLLRKKIEAPGTSALICNVRGIGFKMEADDAK